MNAVKQKLFLMNLRKKIERFETIEKQLSFSKNKILGEKKNKSNSQAWLTEKNDF